MYCGKCGSQLDRAGRFCGSCGAPATTSQGAVPSADNFGSADAGPPVAVSQKSTDEALHGPTRQPAFRWIIPGLIASGILVLFGIGALLLMSSSGTSKDDGGVISSDAQVEASSPGTSEGDGKVKIDDAEVEVGDFSENGMLGMPWGTAPEMALPVFVSRLGTWVAASEPPCISPAVNQEEYLWSYINTGPRMQIRAIFVEGELAAWELDGFGWDGERPSPIWPGMKLSEMRQVARTSLVGPLDDRFQFGPAGVFPYRDELIQGSIGPPYGVSAGEYEVSRVQVYGAFDPVIDQRCLPEM